MAGIPCTSFLPINKLWVLKSISDNFFETSLHGPVASKSTKSIAFSSSVFDSMCRNLSSSFSSTIRNLQVGSMLRAVKATSYSRQSAGMDFPHRTWINAMKTMSMKKNFGYLVFSIMILD